MCTDKDLSYKIAPIDEIFQNLEQPITKYAFLSTSQEISVNYSLKPEEDQIYTSHSSDCGSVENQVGPIDHGIKHSQSMGGNVSSLISNLPTRFRKTSDFKESAVSDLAIQSEEKAFHLVKEVSLLKSAKNSERIQWEPYEQRYLHPVSEDGSTMSLMESTSAHNETLKGRDFSRITETNRSRRLTVVNIEAAPNFRKPGMAACCVENFRASDFDLGDSRARSRHPNPQHPAGSSKEQMSSVVHRTLGRSDAPTAGRFPVPIASDSSDHVNQWAENSSLPQAVDSNDVISWRKESAPLRGKSVQFELDDESSHAHLSDHTEDKSAEAKEFQKLCFRIREQEAQLRKKEALIEHLQSVITEMNQVLRQQAKRTHSPRLLRDESPHRTQTPTSFSRIAYSPSTEKLMIHAMTPPPVIGCMDLLGHSNCYTVPRNRSRIVLECPTNLSKHGIAPNNSRSPRKPSRMTDWSDTLIGSLSITSAKFTERGQHRFPKRIKRYAISGESSQYLLMPANQHVQLPKFDKSDR